MDLNCNLIGYEKGNGYIQEDLASVTQSMVGPLRETETLRGTRFDMPGWRAQEEPPIQSQKQENRGQENDQHQRESIKVYPHQGHNKDCMNG